MTVTGTVTAFDERRGLDRRRGGLGAGACSLAETKYSYEAYLERTRRACDALVTPPRPVAAGRPTISIERKDGLSQRIAS